MFSEPGVYRIWAINNYPAEAETNVATVAVHARR